MKRILNVAFLFICIGQVNAQTWTQMGQDIDGEAMWDRSGWAVSMSSDGSRVAVSARDNDPNGNSSGHVRVYDWDGAAWVQAGLDIDGDEAWDEFGKSIDLTPDGNRLAVGAFFNDGNGTDSGHTKVFEWNGSSWVQMGQDIEGENAGDASGGFVCLSSNGLRVAIGAVNNSDNGNVAGHARVFEWADTAWVQLGQDIDGASALDQLGDPIALSSDGNRLAVESNGTSIVYEWDGIEWTQLGTNLGSGVHSLCFASLGNRLAVGMPFTTNNTGLVRIYDWDGNAWQQVGQDIDEENEWELAGWSVSLSLHGTRVAIGIPYNSDNGFKSGQCRVYDWNGSDWVEAAQSISGEAIEDESGSTVSLSSDGNRVAIGAWKNDGNGDDSGHARIYEVSVISEIAEGVNEFHALQFQNPNNGIFKLTETGELSIFSLDGVLVYGKKIAGPADIDLSSFSDGIYTVRLQSSARTVVRKLVKQ